MTPLPNRPARPAPPAALPPPIATFVDQLVWRGRNRKTRPLFDHAAPGPISFQAERALRMRENAVVYASTGHPLREVHHEPGRGEYRRTDDGLFTISQADCAEELIFQVRR